MTPILHNYDLDDACYAARLMAGVAQAQLTLHHLDGATGAFPLLQTGAGAITGTSEILSHLAQVGARGADFRSADPTAMHRWLAFAEQALAPARAARQAAIFGTGDATSARAAKQALRALEDHMTAQTHLGHGFVAGPLPCVADIALFPAFALCRDWGLDHDGFPALRLWARRIRALPGFIGMPGIPEHH